MTLRLHLAGLNRLVHRLHKRMNRTLHRPKPGPTSITELMSHQHIASQSKPIQRKSRRGRSTPRQVRRRRPIQHNDTSRVGSIETSTSSPTPSPAISNATNNGAMTQAINSATTTTNASTTAALNAPTTSPHLSPRTTRQALRPTPLSRCTNHPRPPPQPPGTRWVPTHESLFTTRAPVLRHLPSRTRKQIANLWTQEWWNFVQAKANAAKEKTLLRIFAMPKCILLTLPKKRHARAPTQPQAIRHVICERILRWRNGEVREL